MGGAASSDKYSKDAGPVTDPSGSLPSAAFAVEEKDISQQEYSGQKVDDKQILRHGKLVQQKDGELTDHYDVRGELLPGYILAVSIKSSEHQAVRCISKKERTAESVHAEVAVLREIDHPNIATLFEVFQDEKNFYLVSELCADGTFAGMLEQEESISEKAAANLMKQVMRGVMYMHDQHYCHRSLHPAAIMLQNCEAGLRSCKVRLVDLQAAQVAEKGKKMKGVVGQVEFAAPQMLLKEPYTVSCDVWSAGALLWVMIMGFVPFPKGAAACLMEATEDKSKWERVCAQKLNEHKPDKHMSTSLLKMIRKMLIFPEKSRWSLEACVRWSWFDEMGLGAPKLALTVSEVESMNNFARMNKLQKMAVHIIARRLPDEAVDKLQEVFDSIDLDCNGIVTGNELQVALKKFKGSTAENSWRSRKACAECMDPKELMRALDTNGNNGLDFTEFAAATLPRKYYSGKGHLHAAFAALDADGSGEISLEELETILLADRQVASEQERESIREVLKAADLNGDGEISFDEFVAMMNDSAVAVVDEPEEPEVLVQAEASIVSRRSSITEALAEMSPSRRSSLPGLSFSMDKKTPSRSSSRNSSKQSTAASAQRTTTGQSLSSSSSGTSVVSRRTGADKKPERRPAIKSVGSFLT